MLRKAAVYLALACTFVVGPLLAQDATSTALQLLYMGNGLHLNDWGTQTNNNMAKIESAVAGSASIVVGTLDYTLTDTEARNGILAITGTLSNNLNVIVPARTKSWIVANLASGGFNITFKPAGGTGLVLPALATTVAWTDGATMRLASDLTSTNAAVSAVTTVANNALPKAGGTMTGAINFGGFTQTNAGAPSSGGDLTTKTYVDGAITTAVGGVTGVPAGAVMAFNLASCPTGWLAANGTAVALDLRGEFIRGLDSGRGVDSGRTLASTQTDLLKSHTHTLDQTVYIGSPSYAGGATPYNPVTSTVSGAQLGVSATGGTETRPRNVALLYCQKT